MIRTCIQDKDDNVHRMQGKPISKSGLSFTSVKAWIEREGLDGVWLQDITENHLLISKGYQVLENTTFVEKM